jgi:serine/threonine protein kinase
MDDALHEKLRDATAEVGNLRQEAYDYEEARRRQKAGRFLAGASWRWKEKVERLLKERRREQRVADAVVEEPMAAVGGGDQGVSFLQFRLSELNKATNSFHESARIGGTGGISRGVVYRGTLRGMSVAVKIISPDVAVHETRFARTVEAMAKAKHPGLVTLLGACPKARAVVHELVQGGSLEDHLSGDAPPLPWHARCTVAYRTCSALAYLHSTGTVHGDVRPANILFEDGRCSSSKLAGLGMSRLAMPKRAGTEALAYVDPRYLATGEPTPQCDVHALGVLLLRLVTGKPASAAKKAAREAATSKGRAWHEVVDASAGGWPMERAVEVAIIGLKCCHVSDGRAPPRPAAELLEEARSVLEAVTSAAAGDRPPTSSSPDTPSVLPS